MIVGTVLPWEAGSAGRMMSAATRTALPCGSFRPVSTQAVSRTALA